MMVNNKGSLDQIEILLNSVAEIDTDYNNIVDLLSNKVLKDYSNKKKEITEKYDLNGTDKFNIFETISDKYKLENFHTDILFSILDPNTPEIAPIRNKEILDNFVATIANDDSFKFKTDGTVNVSKQVYNVVDDKEGFIDLLITNDSRQAIIIENKINDAPDMENQLVRYMKYVREQAFEEAISFEDFKKNVRVVYLTLTPGKKPNIDKYSKKYSVYKNLLKDTKTGDEEKILKYLSAVDKDKDDLVKFLQKCIDILKNDLNIFNKDPNSNIEEKDKYSLKKIYLEQYQILLKHLGGKAKMSELGNEVIEKIYSEPTLLQAAKDLYKILALPDCRDGDGDPAGVDKYIDYLLSSFLKENNFESYKPHNKAKRYLVLWDKDKKDHLYACGECWNLQIGFGTKYPGTISKNNQKKYKKILAAIFSPDEIVD